MLSRTRAFLRTGGVTHDELPKNRRSGVLGRDEHPGPVESGEALGRAEEAALLDRMALVE